MFSCNHSNNWPSFQIGFGDHEQHSLYRQPKVVGVL